MDTAGQINSDILNSIFAINKKDSIAHEIVCIDEDDKGCLLLDQQLRWNNMHKKRRSKLKSILFTK